MKHHYDEANYTLEPRPYMETIFLPSPANIEGLPVDLLPYDAYLDLSPVCGELRSVERP